MKLPHSVCEVLRDHVVLESECIDRMYLNVYVPQLQRIGGVVWYLRGHLGQRFASTAGVAPKTEAFVADIERFVADQGVEMVSFAKHQRKDDVTQQYLQQFDGDEGVLYVGRAQEKARVVRTERRRSATTGATYPWVVDGSAMVNHYYFYCVDADFGPFFLKFCSYFPYNAKLCINGNEYAKCQLRKRGIAFEALDNGVLSCADPKALRRICDALDDKKIDRLLRKWLARLPHPFDRRDRAAGYRYQTSILQAEFALTQVLDRPVAGRIFFEQVIRENLDIGRPGQVQLIFDRRVNRRTPGRFRTRVITEGVTPSLHVDYKRSRIKQRRRPTLSRSACRRKTCGLTGRGNGGDEGLCQSDASLLVHPVAVTQGRVPRLAIVHRQPLECKKASRMTHQGLRLQSPTCVKNMREYCRSSSR